MADFFIKTVFFTVITVFIVSCKEHRDFNKTVIKIETVIQHNDSIRVFYTTDGSINFSGEQALWNNVLGSNKNQEVIFEIPENLKPNQLRIDFGNKVDNQEIILNKICVSYLESTFEAKGEEIYWYFRPDENNTTLDKKKWRFKKNKSNTNKRAFNLSKGR